MTEGQDRLVIVGRIAGVYGVRGWVKIISYTDPRDNILNYRPWWVRINGQWRQLRLEDGRMHGKGLIARLEGVDQREQAQELMGSDIAVSRDQLPVLEQGEYYWSDLIGLEVVNLEGVRFGSVDHLIETGANDVLVVKGERERLIPYIPDVVQQVDVANGTIRVDWSPEF